LTTQRMTLLCRYCIKLCTLPRDVNGVDDLLKSQS
jgi:hypothetical protein